MKPIENLGGVFFLVVLIAILAAMLYILKPYLVVLFLASVLAIVLYPINSHLQHLIANLLPAGWRRRAHLAETTAPIICCLLVLVVVVSLLSMIVVPLAKYSMSTVPLGPSTVDQQTSSELESQEVSGPQAGEVKKPQQPRDHAAGAAQLPAAQPPATALRWRTWVDTIENFNWRDNRRIRPLLDWLSRYFEEHFAGWNLQEKLFDEGRKLIGAITKFILDQTVSVISRAGILVVEFTLMLFAAYFFLREGDVIVAKLVRLSPMSDEHEMMIIRRFGDVSRSAFFGTFLTSLVQGFLAAIPFALFGYGYLIWALILSFFSLIPVIGMAIIWIPFVAFLFIIGRPFAGFAVLIWEMLVGLVDNFLRPWILHKIGSSTSIHPLLMFFSLIGGVQAFGLLGLILGPVIFNLAMTLLQIFEAVYRDQLDSVRSGPSG